MLYFTIKIEMIVVRVFVHSSKEVDAIALRLGGSYLGIIDSAEEEK